MAVVHVLSLPPLPARPLEAHKGTFGRALLVLGSRGMSGAACLGGLGALRGGAGLVTVAVPHGILPIVAAVEPSYLTLGLSEDPQGRLHAAARHELHAVLKNYDVVACGSGWGQSGDIVDLAKWLYMTVAAPLVIDADGLNALAKAPEAFVQALPGPRILTPHPGEFSRLIGTDIGTVQQNRESLAVEFARQKGVVLLLKGAGTIITDGQRVAINQTGNSGMATGGTGDVLTGLITALLAQNLPPFEAAQLGAHLHGLAGDLAAADLSKPALIASDLPRYVGAAWKQLGG
jgi:NAD(P)H-hydrate epimerase